MSRVFPGGFAGRVLLQSGDDVVLFDTSSMQIEGNFTLGYVKHVCWRSDNKMVALVTNSGVYVLDGSLHLCVSARERQHVKGVVWDKTGVLLYCTMSQVKYLLRSGEQGVIRSLDDVVYPLALQGNRLVAMDRRGQRIVLQINTTEFLLKVWYYRSS